MSPEISARSELAGTLSAGFRSWFCPVGSGEPLKVLNKGNDVILLVFQNDHSICRVGPGFQRSKTGG